MRRTVRTVTAGATSCALTLMLIQTATAVPPGADPYAVDATTQTLAAVVGQIDGMEDTLHAVGLSFTDLRGLETRDPAYLAEFEALAAEEFGPFDAAARPLSEATGQESLWLAYAGQIAAVNLARDPDAEDIGTETAYMYLSHYVDLWEDPAGFAYDANSDQNLYAGWITEDDRTVYRSFLRIGTYSLLASDLVETGLALAGLRDKPTELAEAARELPESAGRLRAEVDDLVQQAGDIALAEPTQRLVARWNDSDDPALVVDAIREMVDRPDYGEELRGAVAGVLASALATAGGGLVLDIALTGIGIATLVSKDIIDQTALIGLMSTHNTRVALRYFRSIGF